MIFKNFATFNDCINEINNTKVDNAEGIDLVILMYNLIEYSDNYSWANDAGVIADFTDNGNSKSFNFKEKVRSQIDNNDRKDVQIIVPLKYLSNFWRTFEMSLNYCEINPILTCSGNFAIPSCTSVNQATTFVRNDSKLYVPVVNLLTNGNGKLLQQLKWRFEPTIKWNI